MKNKTWAVLFGGIFLLLCLAAFLLAHVKTGKQIANIYQDGVCISSIDLAALTETEVFTITDEDGCENTIQAEHGRIRVFAASCPDQVCVETGWISDGLQPIVCLPAKLVIRIESDAQELDLDLDAVSG